jgi:coproporphyrinogen III oxidase
MSLAQIRRGHSLSFRGGGGRIFFCSDFKLFFWSENGRRHRRFLLESHHRSGWSMLACRRTGAASRAAAQIRCSTQAPFLLSIRYQSSFQPIPRPPPPPRSNERARKAGITFAAAALGVATLLSTQLLMSPPSREPIQLEAHSVAVSAPSIAELDPKVIEDVSKPMRIRMETYVKLLQNRIVTALGKEEATGSFISDSWQRKEGGEGISCVLQGGSTFEKAGVNISIVHGLLPPRAIAQMSADHAGLVSKVGYKLGLEAGEEQEVPGLPFYASGLSLVVHPKNPFAPTVHFNYRYFELTHPKTLKDGTPNPRYDASDPTKPAAWWFGGGSDLTPVYLFNSDASHFHNTLKKAADGNDALFYPTWKKWCDKYFWIPHRGEARGVGGIFFDDLTLDSSETNAQIINVPNGSNEKVDTNLPHTKESLFRTVRSLGDAFLPSYLPILQSRKNMPYNDEHVDWQAIRRGRYVEFNLVYDRGTSFGLRTPGARIESILMSLPLKASWQYSHKYSGMGSPAEDSAVEDGIEEKKVMQVLRQPKEWATA